MNQQNKSKSAINLKDIILDNPQAKIRISIKNAEESARKRTQISDIKVYRPSYLSQ